MSWTLLIGLVLVLGLSLFASLSRRSELARMRATVEARNEALRTGRARARLAHPVVDLSRCLGCGTCVAVCPEGEVLELVHGQAMVVRGSACVGVAACERECPAGAIAVTLADLGERRDVPVVTEELEAVGTPGLFLAGEVTGHARIRTAVEHGTRVGALVAERLDAAGAAPRADLLDLVIVGAGPAGLACALEASLRGLSFLMLEQEAEVGGTVARYPRGKLVLTEPVTLPFGVRLDKRTYAKEELVELWRQLVSEHALPVQTGEVFAGLERETGGADPGAFLVRTERGVLRTLNVCLALGRRGSPNRLGVPGEDLAKVTYALLDAAAHTGRRVLVVGGGDSAVEAALGLAAQPGNRVTLSYRGEHFARLTTRNSERLEAARAAGTLDVLAPSRVVSIEEGLVRLEVGALGTSGTLGTPHAPHATDTSRGAEAVALRATSLALENDEVIVQAGGTPPLPLLEAAGVSFDPALRPATEPFREQGAGLLRALLASFAVVLAVLVFAAWNADYYLLPAAARPSHAKHALLRPGLSWGLGFGIAATVLVLVNLAYVARRAPSSRLKFGSLKSWMTVHVATGVLALATATLHAAMDPRDTAGGRALAAMVLLVVTGAIGRYFYAWVPRAANGRELELEELRRASAEVPASGDPRTLRFANRARETVLELIDGGQWRAGLVGRVFALLTGQRRVARALAALQGEGQREGVPPAEIDTALQRARRAHRAALAAAHLEDLRGVLVTWRWLHRWVSVLMLLLILLHVFYALSYGQLFAAEGAR